MYVFGNYILDITTRAPNGLGPLHPTKKLAHRAGWTFWANRYVEITFSKF